LNCCTHTSSTPAPFPLLSTLTSGTAQKKQVLLAFHHVVNWVVATTDIPLQNTASLDLAQISSGPFWTLLLLFPSLLLYPSCPRTRETDVTKRLYLLRQGKVLELFAQMRTAAAARPLVPTAQPDSIYSAPL
jgi:hypothetical protein